jgi:hypothetical protein
MQFVGRKLYIALSPSFVVGVSKLMPNWSQFKYETDIVHLQTSSMVDMLGVIFPIDIGRSDYCLDKDTAAIALEELQKWLAADLSSPNHPDWMIGRRLISRWNKSFMISIEGLQVDPLKKFNLKPSSDDNSIFYDLYEFSGVLIERDAQRPFRTIKSDILSIIDNSDYWLSLREHNVITQLDHSPAIKP